MDHAPPAQKTRRKLGKLRPPTEAEMAEAATLILSLRAALARAPAALGRSKLSVDGRLEAPQAVVAEMARLTRADLSAILHGRRPKNLSVGSALERLRNLQSRSARRFSRSCRLPVLLDEVVITRNRHYPTGLPG